MFVVLLKSTLHNVGVIIVGIGFAYLGTVVDSLFGFSAIAFPFAKGVALLAICRALGRRLAVVGLKLQQVVTT